MALLRKRRTVTNPRQHGVSARIILTILVVGATLVCLRPIILPDATSRSIRHAAIALSFGCYDEARAACSEVLAREPDNNAVLLIAGIAASRQFDNATAIEWLDRVDKEFPYAAEARCESGIRRMRQGDVVRAEQEFREALAMDKLHRGATEQLLDLLQLQGRSWEAWPLAFSLYRQNAYTHVAPVSTMSINDTFGGPKNSIERFLAIRPDEPIVLLGAARLDLLANRVQQAEATLRRIVDRHPDLIEAQARLGRILLDRPDEFELWHDGLSAAADLHPEIWAVRAVHAQRRGQFGPAIRCCLEVLNRYPFHQEANRLLPQLLTQTGRKDLADGFGRVLRDLARLVALSQTVTEEIDPTAFRELAEVMFRLGRYEEAIAWCYSFSRASPQDDWSRGMIQRSLAALSAPALPQPYERIDRDEFALPDWSVRSRDDVPSASRPSTVASIRFDDVVADVGLKFQYFNGTTVTDGLDHIIQQPGGGIGVVDFDGDLWPDLYLGQGGVWPVQQGQAYTDRLFQNLDGERARDCTQSAGLDGWRYGHGVSVGDVNDDGFQDVFVCNAGCNRLYLNNGDGSFTDATESWGLTDDRWSISAAIADLNRDGFADLYVVNYLNLEQTLEEQCVDKDRPVGCLPGMFVGEQDQVYLNSGDGQFQNVTPECGVVAPDGKGLGLIVADFDETGRLGIFVANDTIANFFYTNHASAKGEIELQEMAVPMGVAYGERGNFQACMGAACDDVTGDGRLDFFVTNFHNEPNTLYVQSESEGFSDGTRSANLRAPSMSQVGFGCQFLDADLDGWLDIFLTNGHVDRSFATGVADRMTPQFFRNSGQGVFAELSVTGAYFQQECFGRAVARLDWDRDGREDICASHLDVPVALLLNRTRDTGNSLKLYLTGTRSERIPTGTIVTVQCGGVTHMRQLTAGDGYQASNAKPLIFGLGSAATVDRISVRWPSGLVNEFRTADSGQSLRFVEGRGKPVPVFP